MKRTCATFSGLLAAAVVLAGCATAKTSNTGRTATEQLLIANAVDQSLDKVDFTPFGGRKVFLQDKYVDCQDKNYLIASVRHRLLAQGALLVEKSEDAEIGIELRTGGVGTDMSESFVGTPEVVLPGMMTIPEVKFIEKNVQTAKAKIGLVAYEIESRRVLGDGGLTTAVSDNNNWSVLGVGPIQTGSLKNEVSRATSGPNRTVPSKLPPKVAFDAPSTPKEIQYAGNEQPADGSAVTPAVAEEPAAESASANIDQLGAN